jgi:hypothetical protein
VPYVAYVTVYSIHITAHESFNSTPKSCSPGLSVFVAFPYVTDSFVSFFAYLLLYSVYYHLVRHSLIFILCLWRNFCYWLNFKLRHIFLQRGVV